MSNPELKLLNPPIVEAVLDIECELPPGLHLATLEEPAKKQFSDRYPKFRTQLLQENQIVATPVGPPTLSVRHGLQAFQFMQDDEKQLVQVRDQGFSFNRLSPYTSLDDYLPEIESAWHSYLVLATPIQIRLIRLRYINRILLPLIEGGVELEDYFKVGPRLPDEKNMMLSGFFNQHSAVEVQTGHQINIIFTSQPQETNFLPVIFDNSVASVETGDPNNLEWILATILSLRELKNRIFKNTLADSCLKLFQER